MIGRHLGKYEILRKLGAGGMGEVYLARDSQLERDVALKILPPGQVADEKTRKRMGEEALALARLSNPYIATIFDFDSEDSVDFIVMEHVPGVTLKEKLDSGALEVEEFARLATQLANALHCAHEAGVVHRDLKPQNIMVLPNGSLKILDFGIATLRNPSEETATREVSPQTETIVGTPAYMSPEQLDGAGASRASDLFSLGIVFYEMATKQKPFRGEYPQSIAYEIQHGDIPAPSSIREDLSPVIDRIILRLLARSPEDRFASAAELEDALRELDLSMDRATRKHSWRYFAGWTAAILPALVVVFLLAQHSVLSGQPYSTEVNAREIRRLTVTGDAYLPAWSPDGDHIAFAKGGKTYVVSPAGGSPRLIDCDWDTYIPWSWTPDGTQILVMGSSTGSYFVGALGLIGETPRILQENSFQPAMSPDGEYLLYTTVSDTTGYGIWSKEISTGRARLVTSATDQETAVYKAFFSPDGQKISYMFWDGFGHKLRVVNRDGTDDHEVAADPIQLGGLYCWTNDSRAVIIAGQLHGIWSIWKINLSGEGHARLTPGAEWERHVTAAPDGSRFTFARTEDLSRISILDLDDSETALPFQIDVASKNPTFSEDGLHVYFQALVNEQWQVWEAALDDETPPRPVIVLKDLSCSEPVRGPENTVIHLRSSVARQVLWGSIKWSITAWRSSSDGGIHQQIEGAGDKVSRFAPSSDRNETLLYSSMNDERSEDLFVLTGSGDPELIYSDSEDAEFSCFDWGRTDSEVLVAHADTSREDQATCIVTAIDIRTRARQRVLNLAALKDTEGNSIEGSLIQMALSPDRQRLAFILYSQGTRSVFIHELDGTKDYTAMAATKDESPAYLSWAPDSRRLAVELHRFKSDIYISQPSEYVVQ